GEPGAVLDRAKPRLGLQGRRLLGSRLGVQPLLDLPRVPVADDLAGVADLALGDAAVDVALDGVDAAARDLGHHADVVDAADAVGAAPVEEDERARLRLGAPRALLLEPLGVC